MYLTLAKKGIVLPILKKRDRRSNVNHFAAALYFHLSLSLSSHLTASQLNQQQAMSLRFFFVPSFSTESTHACAQKQTQHRRVDIIITVQAICHLR